MNVTPLTRITPIEAIWLGAAELLRPRETAGEAVHLRLRDGRREWTVVTSHGEFIATMHDEDLRVGGSEAAGEEAEDLAEDDPHYALSDRIIDFMRSLRGREATVGLADDATAVLQGPYSSAAIDLVPGEPPTLGGTPVRMQAWAEVELGAFLELLGAARSCPTGLGDTTYPFPPFWLQIEAGMIHMYVDWRDFLPTRSTFSLVVEETEGEALVAIEHRIISDVLAALAIASEPDEDPVITVGVGRTVGTNIEVVVIGTESWKLLTPVVDFLARRWGTEVAEQLSGWEVVNVDTAHWSVVFEHCSVDVQLHHGHPDQVRVATALLSGLSDTYELLRELSTLNAASRAVRFWFEDGVLWAAVDLPCTRIDDLGGAVQTVADAAATYAPLLTALA